MSEKKERDWSIHFAIAVVGIPVAIFFALDVTLLPYWKDGRVTAAELIATAEGERVFVVETVSDGEDSTLARLSLYDFSSPTTKPVVTWSRRGVHYEGYAGDRLWFSSGNQAKLGWHARDPLTLAVNLTQPELAKRDARLRHVHEGEFTGGGLRFTTVEGYVLRVDAKTLAIQEGPEEPKVRKSPWGRPSLTFTSSTVELDGKRTLGFEGRPRASLTVERKAVAGDETWIQPQFLTDRADSGRPFVLADPESVLVLHRKTVESGAPLSITRVEPSGKVVWTLPLDEEQTLVSVSRLGNRLIVAAENSVRSVSVQDGAVAVRHDF